MSSEVKANKLSPATGTDVTLGDSGDTFTIPSGATIDASAATATGFDSGLASVQTFTSSGTWTRPSGITKVIMEVQGAGGSGSGSPNGEDCNGGGAGGYAKKFLDVSSISTSTITVGAGGAGVTGGTGGVVNGGNAGGASSWADGTNTVTGNGGTGGSLSHYAGTEGATATGGDINIKGGSGYQILGSYGGFRGGSSILGNGGMGKYVGRGTSGWPPSGYGAGSGSVFNDSGSYTSDTGGAGIVIVWEYK